MAFALDLASLLMPPVSSTRIAKRTMHVQTTRLHFGIDLALSGLKTKSCSLLARSRTCSSGFSTRWKPSCWLMSYIPPGLALEHPCISTERNPELCPHSSLKISKDISPPSLFEVNY